MRGETVTIVGLAAWVRPVPRKQSSALRLRIERRRQWMVEQERQRLINAANAAAEREEMARRWFAEGGEPAPATDPFGEPLPIFLQEQAG